jgi:hypothetical protein
VTAARPPPTLPARRSDRQERRAAHEQSQPPRLPCETPGRSQCRRARRPVRAFVEGLETYEFIDLGDGRTEHRWLRRADDRTPEGIRAFEEAFASMKEFAADPSWGDQLRGPLAEDAAMYGLDRPLS